MVWNEARGESWQESGYIRPSRQGSYFLIFSQNKKKPLKGFKECAMTLNLCFLNIIMTDG